MFGIFKKKNNPGRCNEEIETLISMAIIQGQSFADRVIWKFPQHYDQAQLSDFLKVVAEKIRSNNYTYGELKKRYKIGFKFSWFICELSRRSLISLGLEDAGNYVYDKMTDRLVEVYTEYFSQFIEGSNDQISRYIFEQINKMSMEYSKYSLLCREQEDTRRVATVAEAIAHQTYEISDDVSDETSIAKIDDEFFRILMHLLKCANDDSIGDRLSKIKKVLAG